MSYFNMMPSIPLIKPAMNVGCFFDIITGSYYIGKHGESILCGGAPNIFSIAGPGNSFKSVLAHYVTMSLAERYSSYQCSVYDSESSFTYRRLKRLSRRFPKMSQVDHGNETMNPEDIKFTITSASEMMGDKYFDIIKKMYDAKIKEKKALLLATPFVNGKGDFIEIMRPTGSVIDSLSQLEVSSLNEATVDVNLIGDSGNNMIYAKTAIAKKQLIGASLTMGESGSMYFLFVAHVGDEFPPINQYQPKQHKLTHAKKGSKITGTTKAFEFINQVVYEIQNVSIMNNKEKNTGVLYPKGDLDKEDDTADLLVITAKPIRNKLGPSGVPLDFIVSQREGLLPHLSQFHLCKLEDFGIVGNNTTYAMALYPECKLQRTTVRTKIDDDYKLRRVMEITSEMLLMKQLWDDVDDIMCDPEVLHADLIEQGYDWNVLLETRGYWVFEEDKDGELPFLSTMDLLLMRLGKYKPYWLEEK